MTEPRYAYFTVLTPTGPLSGTIVGGLSCTCGDTGFVCVRLERPKGENHCRATFAFCSPQDADQYWDSRAGSWQFSRLKPLARKIADARALTKRVKATIEFEQDGPIGEAFRRALELAKTTERPWHKRCGTVVDREAGPPTMAPRWFRDAVKVEFGLVQPEE